MAPVFSQTFQGQGVTYDTFHWASPACGRLDSCRVRRSHFFGLPGATSRYPAAVETIQDQPTQASTRVSHPRRQRRCRYAYITPVIAAASKGCDRILVIAGGLGIVLGATSWPTRPRPRASTQ